MLTKKEAIKLLKSYNINSTKYGPSIYEKEDIIGLSLEIKDSTFGFLTRFFPFKNSLELDNFLKGLYWYKKNHRKWNITLSLDNYEIPNPNLIYTYNNKELTLDEMLNLEENINEIEEENNNDYECNSLYTNIEGLTNYLINLQNTKNKVHQEKQTLKIAENELKYKLLESLNIYYGKNKEIVKRPVNIEPIINNNINYQEKLKEVKDKDLTSLNNYLKDLINTLKKEELDEKYLINIYSNNVYKYNIEILNKQIDFVNNKIESEKNFNLKGSKIHNIDEELKSFLNTNNPPLDIKDFLNTTKNKINEKYNKIDDLKNSYYLITGSFLRMPIKKSNNKIPNNPLNELNKAFDSLNPKEKAYAILYNSFYKETYEILSDNPNITIDELNNQINFNKTFKELEEIIYNTENSHYLANYFKYLNFNNINTYFASIKELVKTITNINIKLSTTLKVFCIENNNHQTLLSINPIYSNKEKTYIITLPENTSVLYIPDKIIIDENEMNTISSQNIYISSSIIDTSDYHIINKYQKINEIDKENNITIAKDLKLKEKYIFNIGVIA